MYYNSNLKEYDNFQDKPEYVGFWHVFRPLKGDERDTIFNKYNIWMEQNKIKISGWRRSRGYLGMRSSEFVGVYFRQTDHALLFRLRFGL